MNTVKRIAVALTAAATIIGGIAVPNASALGTYAPALNNAATLSSQVTTLTNQVNSLVNQVNNVLKTAQTVSSLPTTLQSLSSTGKSVVDNAKNVVKGNLVSPTHNTPNSPAESDAKKERFGVLLNQHRAANGLAPVVLDQTLASQSQSWSDVMANDNYLRHSHKYPVWENIAFSGRNETPEEFFRIWLESPPHNATMLNPDMKHYGYGYATNPQGQNYATLQLTHR